MNPRRSLDNLRVAKPCPASWDEMDGDGHTRHCSQCDRKVFNISDMTREEASKLLDQNAGRLCVRYYMRSDGTVMTRDCGSPIPDTRNYPALAAASLVLASIPVLTSSCIMGQAATPPDKPAAIKSRLTKLKKEIAGAKTSEEKEPLVIEKSSLQSALSYSEDYWKKH